jgi:hypothetical protein
MEDKLSGLEDKVDVIEKLDEDKFKKMKKYDWNMQEFCYSI